MSKVFMMNGNQYNTLSAIAKELGVARIRNTEAQFKKYGITEVTDDAVVDVAPAADEVTEVAEVVEDVPAEVVEAPKAKADKPAKVAAGTEKAPKADKPAKVEDKPLDIDEVFAKASEDGMDVVKYNAIIGKLALVDLVALAEKAEVENLWGKIENEPIRKMRVLMEIKAKLFPGQKTPVKPASAWRKVALEDIVALADEKGLEYRKVDNDKIQRMWVVKALTDAGITPDELKADEPEDSEEDAPAEEE